MAVKVSLFDSYEEEPEDLEEDNRFEDLALSV